MKWRLLFFGKKREQAPEQDDHTEELDKELESAEQKLADTRAQAPELARAVASARRVNFRVDQFTEEISKSFGRLNHGPG